MSEDEYIIEMEEKEGRWTPIAGEIYRDKYRAEERSKQAAEEMSVKTRVAPRIPIWDEWNFAKLAARLEGTAPAIREMKKRGETGAIAGWAIYKGHVKNLIKLACGAGPEGEWAREPAYRSTMMRDLDVVWETKLIEQINELWKKHPKAIPTSDMMDLQEDWNKELESRVGKTIPKSPSEMTREDIEASKKITREMHIGKTEIPEAITEWEPVDNVSELEEMKAELERRIERLKGNEE